MPVSEDTRFRLHARTAAGEAFAVLLTMRDSECMETNAIEVQMLGGFSIAYRGVEAGGQSNLSRKVKNLLAYLLYHHHRMIPVEELVGVLGGEHKNAAPVAAFRTALHRVRRAVESIQAIIGQPLIITQNGMCGWNPEVAVEEDAERFEAMCRADVPDGPDGAQYYRRTLELYQGDFLRGLDSEQWVEPLAEYYRSLYLAEVEMAAPVMIENGLASCVEQCCREALYQAPYHEVLCRWLMRALAARNDRPGALVAYEELRARLYEDLGVTPEEETQQIYWSIARNEDNILTPEGIRAQLREYHASSGVFVCDYSLFKLFYQAEARAAARRGDAIHMGLLSVLTQEGNVLSEHELERTMAQLSSQMQKNLRSGDIAARCSPSQYILMLVQANYENSKLVCDRVAQAFFRTHPGSPVKIETVVFPLEPSLEGQGHGEDEPLKLSQFPGRKGF